MLRGRPLIIWGGGGVVRIEKKICSEGRQKKKLSKRPPKKNYVRSIQP